MFIKRNHSRTKREFDKLQHIFYREPSYERSNTVIRRNFCLDDFQKAKSFRFFDLECTFKMKHRQPRRQLL